MPSGEGKAAKVKKTEKKKTIGLKQKSNFVCTPQFLLDISLPLFCTTTK